MRRAIAAALLGVTGMLLTLAVFTGFLVLSETGLQWLWQRLEDVSGEVLTARTVEGRLAGTIRLEGVRYKTGSLHLSADELQLDWTPQALLRGTLHIDRLTARGTHYEQGQPEPAVRDTPLVLPGQLTFPLRVRLGALEVHEGSITTNPGAAPLHIKEARLQADIHGSRVTIESISAKTPGLVLQGSATLRTTGDYPVEGAFDWHASPEGYAALNGRTRVDGSLQRLRLQFALAAPYAASVAVELDRPLAAQRLSGTLTLRETDLAAIKATWPALRVTVSLQAEGTPDHLQLDAGFSSKTPQTGALQGTLRGLLLPGALQLEALQAATVNRSATLGARGWIEFSASQPVFDLQADWQELSWPLQHTAAINSARGELTLSGTLDAYHFAVAALLDVPEYTDGHVHLDGQGNRQSIELTEFGIKAAEGTLGGSGRIDWVQELTARLEMRGEQINPALIWPEWPGLLELKLQAELAAAGETWSVRFDTAQASGTLRGFPLQLDTRGHYRPGQLQLEEGRVVSGPSRLALSGEIGTRLALAWNLNSPDLATLLPGAAGRLSGAGKIHGMPSAALIQATLEGSQLRYREDRIDSLNLDAHIDLSGGTESRLALTQEGGVLAGLRVEHIELRGSGYPLAHRLGLTGSTGRGDLDLHIEGDWQAPDWRYRLARGRYTEPEARGIWTLEQATTGLVSASQASLPEHCWDSGTARACLQAGYDRKESTAGLRIDRLPLAYFLHSQAAGVGMTGTLTATAAIRHRPEQPLEAQLDVSTSPGRLVIEVEDGVSELLGFGEGTAMIELDRHGARLNARLPLDEGAGGLSAQAGITAAERPWVERKLQGEFKLVLPDIAFASALSPAVDNLRGRIDGQVKLSGTLAAPRMLGTLRLADAGMGLATLGLTLHDVDVEISGQETGDLDIAARARSGEGIITLAGQTNLTAPTPGARLQLSGDRVQVLNTPEAEIRASPDLAFILSGTRVDVSGEVRVPFASIEPHKLPESAVTVSPDQLIVTESAPVTKQAPYQVQSRVRFILGEDVSFDGLGLTGRLQGNVLASSEPGRPASANGELGIVDGKYRAYRQNLEIRTGRLLFAGGPINEPGLDVEAVRRPAADILVGVRARGNLRTPKLTVFSEPGMPQSQQLSWLILGRDLERSTSDEEKSAMNEAAMMLGLTGGEALGKQLGKKIGVDEISIDSESGGTTTQASLLVGKYLTPELFVSYGIGIFEPVSTLRLLYTLSSHWKLVGEASALRSAADIFYVIERGN